jgi:hypothetical protein
MMCLVQLACVIRGFGLWCLDHQWQSLYTGDSTEESTARQVLQSIVDSYVLVNIVDNDYYSLDEDIFRVLREVTLRLTSRVCDFVCV